MMAAAPAPELTLLLDVDNTLVMNPDVLNETLIASLLKIKAKAHLFTGRMPTASIRHLMGIALATATTSDDAIKIQTASPSLLTNLVAILRARGLELDTEKPVLQFYDIHPDRDLGATFSVYFKDFEEKIKSGALRSIIDYFLEKGIRDPIKINLAFNRLDLIITTAIKKLADNKLSFTWQSFFEAVSEQYKKAEAFKYYLEARFYELSIAKDLPRGLTSIKSPMLFKLAKTTAPCTYVWIDDDDRAYEDARADRAITDIMGSVHFLHQEPRFMSQVEYAKQLAQILTRIIIPRSADASIFKPTLTAAAVSESKACGGAGARAEAR